MAIYPWKSPAGYAENMEEIRRVLRMDLEWPLTATAIGRLVGAPEGAVYRQWVRLGVACQKGGKAYLEGERKLVNGRKQHLIQKSGLQAFLHALEKGGQKPKEVSQIYGKKKAIAMWFTQVADSLHKEDPDDWPMYAEDLAEKYEVAMNKIVQHLLGIGPGKKLVLKHRQTDLGIEVELKDWRTFVHAALRLFQGTKAYEPMGSASLEAARAFLARTRK